MIAVRGQPLDAEGVEPSWTHPARLDRSDPVGADLLRRATRANDARMLQFGMAGE